jgi:hypothetical protein
VQPQHSAHTASPVLRAVEDSTYLANSLLSGGTYPSPLRPSDLPPARPTRPPADTARDVHLGAASAPTTHAPTSTSPPFLACPSQQTGRSPKPVADGRRADTPTHTGTPQRGPRPMARTRTHPSCPPTHPLKHPRTVRAPPTDTCAHVRFLIRIATLSRLGYLLFMSWCSVV